MNSKIKNVLRPYYHSVRYGTPEGYIFMLHRVGEKDKERLSVNENMKVNQEFLDTLLKKSKEKFDFIRFEDVPKRLEHKSKRNFMVFTFDDGYRDNITNALPVFKRHQIPFTIFLSTDFADRKAILWWYVLEDIVLSSDRIVLSKNRVFECITKKQKEDTFLKIRKIILDLNQNDLVNELNMLFDRKIDWTTRTNDLAISWSDINQFKSETMLSIGGHTKSHCNLKSLKYEKEVYEEIMSGIDSIRNNTGINAKVFAYPYGSQNEVGNREIKIAAECGLDAACLAYGGYCTKRHKSTLLSLPRIMLTEDFDYTQLM